MCARPELLQNGHYSGKYKTNYYFSDKYKFSYCKVPKGGSTFWTQTFNVLRDGATKAKEIYAASRVNVQHAHGRNNFNIDFDKMVKQDIGSVLVSRDPYSRLYSAFVDRAYLPIMITNEPGFQAMQSAAQSLGDGIPKECPKHATFEAIVRYMISEAKRGATLDGHWAPIYSKCRPCDVNARMLVKLESFGKDVEHVLHEVGVESDIFSAVMDALHNHHVEDSVSGIVETIERYTKMKKIVRDCFGYLEVEERLWRSFQIQGYISNTIPFPKQELKNKISAIGKTNYDALTDVILKTIQKHPLTSTESKQQRKRALVDAFSSFSPDTIRGIQEVYYQDFVLYNYDMQPPSM